MIPIKIDRNAPLYRRVLAYRADDGTWDHTYLHRDYLEHPEYAYTYYVDIEPELDKLYDFVADGSHEVRRERQSNYEEGR